MTDLTTPLEWFERTTMGDDLTLLTEPSCARASALQHLAHSRAKP